MFALLVAQYLVRSFDCRSICVGQVAATLCSCPLVAFTPLPIAVERNLNSIQKVLLANRFGEEFYRASFHAFTDIGMSPWPVTKMIGISI